MPNEFVARNGIIALNNSIITGSLNVTQGVTASLFGTASWANNATTASYVLNAVSASYALSASQAQNAVTASYVLNAVSASYALTSSNVQGGLSRYIPVWSTNTKLTSSVIYQNIDGYIGIGVTDPEAELEITNIFSIRNPALSAAKARFYWGNEFQTFNIDAYNSGTPWPFSIQSNGGNVGIGTSYPNFTLDVIGNGRYTSGLTVTGSLIAPSITGSLLGTASWATNTITASYILNAVSASYALSASNAQTASYILNAVSSSFAATASSADNFTVRGTLTAQTLVVQTVTSSVDFVTGSTRFGSTLSNTHQFTGSLSVTGGLAVNATTSNFTGSVNVNGSVNLTTDQPFRLYNGASFVGGLGSTNWAGGGVNTDTGLYSTNNLWLYAGTSVRMAISSSGNVGIGTTTPAEKLDVYGSIVIRSNYNLSWGSSYGANVPTISGASGVNPFIAFYGAGSTGGEHVRLTSAGNVGIGTTSPTEKLVVHSGNIKLFSLQNVADQYRYIGTEYDANNGNNRAEIRFAIDGGDTNTRMSFHTAAGGGTINERMRITSAGNVGIGTTSPNARLDVSGSAIVSGSFTVSPSNAVELQVTSIGVNLGNISTDIHSVTGSLRVNGSITGSLFGTASYATQALSASWAPGGGGGSAPTAVTFNRVTGSYTFVLTDAGKTIEVSGSTNVSHSLTVPASSSVDFADGTYIDVILYGTGSILFATASGVTIRSANNWNRIGTRYGAATLVNISGNEWYLIGNINP